MNKHRSLLLSIAVLAAAATAHSQILFDGTTYTQNFDTLNNDTSLTNNAWTDNSTILGWYTSVNGGAAMTSYNTQTGTSNTANSYSFVSNSGNTDVSLGAAGNTTRQYAVRIVNNTGGSLTAFDLEYNAQFWRQTGSSKTMTVDYQVFSAGSGSVTAAGYTNLAALSYTTPTTGGAQARNGNAVGNNETLSVHDISFSLVDGAELWLRWTIPAVGANSSALAFDDIVFSAVPEPSVLTAAVAGLGMLAIFSRRRRA